MNSERTQMNTLNFSADANKAIEELRNDLRRLLGNRLVHMALFGSRVRGDHEEDSDIDIAIIVDNLSREVKNKIFKNVAEIELKYQVPISTIVLSTTEFDRLRKRERRIALDIQKEGVSL